VTLAVLVTTALVTAASYLSPTDYAATVVGGVFLAATYVLVLRRDAQAIQAFGLSLGGLLEPAPLDPKRLLRDGGRALLVAVIAFAVIALPFAFGYRAWTGAKGGFHWQAALPDADDVLGQVLVIALPEEAFFRGYLQTRLDAFFPKTVRILGLPIGFSIILTSAIFAIGHYLTVPHPSRLAVFFPSLLFGALRAREGGIGSSVLLHAMCNLLSAGVGRGFSGKG
jgi:uncharacterized protein